MGSFGFPNSTSYISLDPDEIFTRVCLEDKSGLDEILQDGFTLSCLDYRKYTPALESPQDRRQNVFNVCETFGVSIQTSHHLLRHGFQSTALVALVDEKGWANFCSLVTDSSDDDIERLTNCSWTLQQYPLEPIHSLLRIVRFREYEACENGHALIRPLELNAPDGMMKYLELPSKAKARHLVKSYNLEGSMKSLEPPAIAKGRDLYNCSEVNSRHHLVGVCTFNAKSYFPPIKVSNLEDITGPDIITIPPEVPTGRDPEQPQTNLLPLMIPPPSHPVPPPPPIFWAPTPTPPPMWTPSQWPSLVEQPPNFSSPPPPTLPTVIVPVAHNAPFRPYIYSPQVSQPATPSLENQMKYPPPQSKTPLESFLDPNVDQIRYRSGSGSSNSSNSLKEEFDHEKQTGPTNKNDRRNTPVIYNHSSHNSTPTTSKGGKGSKNNRRESWGSKNNLSFNSNSGGASRNFFCPFIDCKNYRNPIAINTSFSAHLIEAHRGYEVSRKALEVEPQIGLDKRMECLEDYAAYKGRHSPKYHFLHGIHSFYENHKRLGQVRLRVEYRIFSPDFFWWGPKAFVIDGLEFFASAFKLKDEYPELQHQHTPKQCQGELRIVFYVQVNAPESVAERYKYNVELPLANEGQRKTIQFHGNVFSLSPSQTSRVDATASPQLIRKMVWFYRPDVAKHVDSLTGKIPFTLGLYKKNSD